MNKYFTNKFEKCAKLGIPSSMLAVIPVQWKEKQLYERAPEELKRLFDVYESSKKITGPSGMVVIGLNGAGDYLGYRNGSYYTYFHEDNAFGNFDSLSSWKKEQ